jgi:hypothetical protein
VHEERGNFKIVPVDRVDSALDEIPPGTGLVIGDSDGISAVEAASRITSRRTAVFVGNLASGEERRAAEELGAEIFGD